MKKLFLSGFIILVFSYLLYQNWAVWLLQIISIGSGQSQSNTNISSSGPTPPYKDGTYTGSVADAIYGNIQVQATIQNGKITDVQFLQHPSDRSTSVAINIYAMPNLRQEAITAQSANVDTVSGATDSSQAFVQSLSSALTQAK